MDAILEVKHTLDGRTRTFSCRAIEVTDERAVLLYTLSRPGRVADLPLPAGTLTVGYFWRDRPYNVYHWVAPERTTLGYYFNLSGPVHLSRDRVEWEDLEVDVLVTPDVRVRVLDEDRIPDAAASRLDEIARARARVLGECKRVVQEVQATSTELLARTDEASARRLG
jgi:predicted RNA-binding protein associated with RNAse of E/G family